MYGKTGIEFPRRIVCLTAETAEIAYLVGAGDRVVGVPGTARRPDAVREKAKVGGFTTNVDRWQIIDFVPPAFLRLDVGATPTGTGAPDGKRVGGINMRNLNAITPETDKTSHYFWGQAHDFDVRNAELTNRIFEQIQTAFYEDVAVFSAQQRSLDLIPNPPQVDINADTGVIQARRILARLHDEEQGALHVTAAE